MEFHWKREMALSLGTNCTVLTMFKINGRSDFPGKTATRAIPTNSLSERIPKTIFCYNRHSLWLCPLRKLKFLKIKNLNPFTDNNQDIKMCEIEWIFFKAWEILIFRFEDGLMGNIASFCLDIIFSLFDFILSNTAGHF